MTHRARGALIAVIVLVVFLLANLLVDNSFIVNVITAVVVFITLNLFKKKKGSTL